MASLLDGLTICIPGHAEEVQLTFSHASWGTAITYNYDGTTGTVERPVGWDPNSGIRWDKTVTLPFTGETTVTWTDVEGGDTPHSGEIRVLEVSCPASETTTTAPPITEATTTTEAPPPPTETSTSTTTTVPATTTSAPTTAPTTAATTTAPAPATTVEPTIPTTVPSSTPISEPAGCCSDYQDTTTTAAPPKRTTTTVGTPGTMPVTGAEASTFVSGGGAFLLFGALCIAATRIRLNRG